MTTGCALFVGCIPARSLTAQRISVAADFSGCPMNELRVQNASETIWTATCRGAVYYCTSAPYAACTRAQ
ncbi:hypothetical protein GN316_06960 [Xylophilus sp. Kf1]|nr:hypothetical protein [Xylophilus sp. Kf1]